MKTSTPACMQCELYTCKHKNSMEQRVQTVNDNGDVEIVGRPIRTVSGIVPTKECSNCKTANGEHAIKCANCKLPLIMALRSKEVFKWKSIGGSAWTRIYGSITRVDSFFGKITWTYHGQFKDEDPLQTIRLDQIKDDKVGSFADVMWHIGTYKDYRNIISPNRGSETVLPAEPPLVSGDMKCAYCSQVIVEKYVDQHYTTHIKEFKPKQAIVHSAEQNTTSITVPHRIIDLTKFKKEKDVEATKVPVLRKTEEFKFRDIVDISATSSCSKDKRFSDFAITLWLKEKVWTHNGSHMGAGWAASKEFMRILILLQHDSVDDYYDVSVQLIKRGTYYNSDTVEDRIPERLCCDMPQAMNEIRKALLYLSISPIAALKRFVKLLREEDDLVFEIDEDGEIIEVSTSNHNGLLTDLDTKREEAKNDDMADNWEAWMGGC